MLCLSALGAGLVCLGSCISTILCQQPTTVSLYLRLYLFLAIIPAVSATPTQSFPGVTFSTFSQFISNNFHSDISLATVLMLLFTMTENTDLLNLHSRQQHPQYESERRTTATGWIKTMARDVIHRLDNRLEDVFLHQDQPPNLNQKVTKIALRLDGFASLLGLKSFNSNGTFNRKLSPVSYDRIRGIPIICPSSMYCMNSACERYVLLQSSKLEDIPLVTLIKDNNIFRDVPVLTGKCSTCQTIYHADHDRFKDRFGIWNKTYLNSARYLKVGQSVWVDRAFSHGVINGMYNFHASAAAYTQYWNDSLLAENSQFQLSRRHVWQAFVQESIRLVAKVNGTELDLQDNISIDSVTKAAFRELGNKGILQSGLNHSCSQCSQPHKAMADRVDNDDPAAVAGVDDNHGVPELIGDNAQESAEDTARARQEAQQRRADIEAHRSQQDEAMDVDDTPANPPANAPVNMVIIDGIVMGPTVCICYIWKSLY